MGQQSTMTIVLRALVMLTCLVVIPAVAIFGDSCRELAETWLDGPWPPAWLASTDQDEPDEDAPRFEALGSFTQVEGTQATMAPRPFSTPPGAQPLPPRGAEPPLPEPSNATLGQSSVVAAGFESDLQPSDAAGSLAPSGEFSVEPPPGDARFSQMHERLRQLGATYVLLESWGDQHQAFRFYCKIAVAGNPHYTYRFEATDTDPVRAMAKVVDQVERWRAQR